MNNSIHLVGNAGNDPELITLKSGAKVAKFSLAVKDFGGGDEVKTMWIEIEAWGQNVERVREVVRKGRELAVMGRLSVQYYEKEVGAETIKMTKVVVKMIGFHACGRKQQADLQSSEEDASKESSQSAA